MRGKLRVGRGSLGPQALLFWRDKGTCVVCEFSNNGYSNRWEMRLLGSLQGVRGESRWREEVLCFFRGPVSGATTHLPACMVSLGGSHLPSRWELSYSLVGTGGPRMDADVVTRKQAM